jgi:hypothetical protein
MINIPLVYVKINNAIIHGFVKFIVIFIDTKMVVVVNKIATRNGCLCDRAVKAEIVGIIFIVFIFFFSFDLQNRCSFT